MTGLCSIHMNGEVVNLKFGLPACRYFAEHISEEHIAPVVNDSLNETGLGYLLYAGYFNHCIIKDEKPIKELSEFMEFIELNIDNPDVQAELIAVGKCFDESKPAQKFMDQA